MRKATLVGLICVLALGAGSSAQQGALQTAADALGVANIKTLQFTGSGANFSVGQNYTPTEPWPPVTVKSYTGVDQLRHRQHARGAGARDGRR